MPKVKSSEYRFKQLLPRGVASCVMGTPCARCRRSGSRCIMSVESGKCFECIRKARSCDLITTPADWQKVDAAEKKIKDHLASLEKEADKLAVEADELAARLAELNKKRRELLEEKDKIGPRRAAMFARELESIEELQALERAAEEGAPPSPDSDSAVPPVQNQVGSPQTDLGIEPNRIDHGNAVLAPLAVGSLVGFPSELLSSDFDMSCFDPSSLVFDESVDFSWLVGTDALQ